MPSASTGPCGSPSGPSRTTLFFNLLPLITALIAAVVFSLLAETLRLQLPYGYMMVLGLLLILCVMYLPNGLATLWQRRKPAAEAHHG